MTALHGARLLVPAALAAVMAVAPWRGDQAGPPASAALAASPAAPAVPLDELYVQVGAADAPVTVVQFVDFGCRYCAQFAAESFPVLREEYVETGRVLWRVVPFVLGAFPNAGVAVQAAGCVAEQDRPDAFWAFHDALFERRPAWQESRDPDALLARWAGEAGADPDAFAACYGDVRAAERELAADALARRMGVRSTPTFFVQGRPVQGLLPLETFRRLLDEAR